MTNFRWLLLSAIVCLSVVTAFGSVTYILGDPNQFSYPFTVKYQQHLLLVRSHGVASALTLLLGALGFVPRLPYHRRRGQLYMLCLLFGALTAVPMSLMAEGGPSSRAGFLLISTRWLFTGWNAYRTARQRDFALHRIWVFRNFALTFGAVVFRFYLYHMQKFGWSFHDIYPSAVWVSWLSVMLVAEVLLRPYQRTLAQTRSEAASPSGEEPLMNMPVPISKPAIFASRGTTAMYQ